ncbi:MAG: hypothetical protein KatS3mg019_0582 [Fimbriimonadales bacterium]|nr:MAG: hypothetical protein KatS3mg019_0582 [Fimbriimonadales bacterium]
MRRRSLRVVRQLLARKRVAKVFVGMLCVSLVLPLRFGMASVSDRLWSLQVSSDEQAPTIVINIPDDSMWLKAVTPQVTVHDDTDPAPVLRVYLDGEPYKVGTVVREQGLHELRAIAHDASGNESETIVYFQILEEPHYIATLSVVEYRWWEEGDYAGLDIWLLLHGPFVPDRRLQSRGNYPESVPVCVVKPLDFSLWVLDSEAKLLNVGELILPHEVKECPDTPLPAPCGAVYYDYTEDKVALRFYVTPAEKRLRRGHPAVIRVVGFGTVRVGDFTFETAVSPVADLILKETLATIISRGNCTPCVPPASKPQTLSNRRCECQWKSFPARKLRSDIDGDTRSRGCAISPGWTEEKYRIHARPSRIDGWGYAFDMCEAQNAMIPTPHHRGVVPSGLMTTPALIHRGPCCCKNGLEITINGTVSFGVTVRTRGDARAQIAGVIRVANNIADIQAAGGLDIGSGVRGGSVSIGPVTVPITIREFSRKSLLPPLTNAEKCAIIKALDKHQQFCEWRLSDEKTDATMGTLQVGA